MKRDNLKGGQKENREQREMNQGLHLELSQLCSFQNRKDKEDQSESTLYPVHKHLSWLKLLFDNISIYQNQENLGQWFFHKFQKIGWAGTVPITKMKKHRLRDITTLLGSWGLGVRTQVSELKPRLHQFLSASSWLSPLCLHSS